MRRLLILVCLLVASSVLAAAATAGTTALGGRPLALVSTGGSVWALTCDSGCSGTGRQSLGHILRIDPRSGRVVARTPLAVPGRIAVGAGAVYAPDFWSGTIRRFDAHTLRRTSTLTLRLPATIPPHGGGFLPDDVAVGAGGVWIATEWCALARTDRAALRTTAVVRLPCDAYAAIATVGRDVWVSESLAGLYRIDPTTNRVAARARIGPASRRLDVTQLLPAGGRLLAIGGWCSYTLPTGENALVVLDPRTGRSERTVPLPRGDLVAAANARWLWVAEVGGSTAERIDAATGAPAGRIHARVGVALVVSGDRVLTAFRDGALARVA